MRLDLLASLGGQAFAGGLLIGLAVALLLLLSGRIAGVSGILGGVLLPAGRRDWLWRAAFVAGLLLSPVLVGALATPSAAVVETPLALLAVAGVLVGFGARLGSGCTSGHGICGVARLSPRSLAATATFMGTGFLTVLVLRHALGGQA
ncbi:MAG: YeeE/YedE family protein [Azonexus sp.]|jgi:uncharacterized membrane protein YedE/YeeE|nr:YeeE/YedE family protein [Betaproteobacteria bacterium]MBK8918642.1 YeeE/YedE family protein [Betaproteobacteria bacterium]MBP6034575.1 YeeE/YedE family protein [Azonexus sp.]MBP6905115.1 YeeE/YedE family protein [Azonexus sp.]